MSKEAGEAFFALLVIVILLASLVWLAVVPGRPSYEERQAKVAKTYKIQVSWASVYYCDKYGYDDSKALVLTDCYRYEEVRIENPVGVVIIKQGGQEQ